MINLHYDGALDRCYHIFIIVQVNLSPARVTVVTCGRTAAEPSWWPQSPARWVTPWQELTNEDAGQCAAEDSGVAGMAVVDWWIGGGPL